MSIPLALTPTVNAGTNGQARISVGPQRFGQKWIIDRIVITTNNEDDVETSMRMYRNSETPSTFLAGTYSGNNDTDNTVYELQTLDKLIFVWEGSAPGKTCMAGVYGKIVEGR